MLFTPPVTQLYSCTHSETCYLLFFSLSAFSWRRDVWSSDFLLCFRISHTKIGPTKDVALIGKGWWVTAQLPKRWKAMLEYLKILIIQELVGGGGVQHLCQHYYNWWGSKSDMTDSASQQNLESRLGWKALASVSLHFYSANRPQQPNGSPASSSTSLLSFPHGDWQNP